MIKQKQLWTAATLLSFFSEICPENSRETCLFYPQPTRSPEPVNIMQIRERNEEGMGGRKKKFFLTFLFSFLRARASRGSIALRNTRKTPGKERDRS